MHQTVKDNTQKKTQTCQLSDSVHLGVLPDCQLILGVTMT